MPERLSTEAPSAQQQGAATNMDTENFLNTLVNKYKNFPSSNNQKGGDHYGKRKLRTYQETALNNNENNNNNNNNNKRKRKRGDDHLERETDFIGCDRVTNGSKISRSDELSRLINRQGDEIHKRVIEKITTLMDVDEETARDYKSGLWQMVRKQNPGEVSNLDLSVQMEKMATKANLKKINLEQAKTNRADCRKRREEQFKKRRNNGESTSEEVSDTSPGSVLRRSDLSSTSFEDDDEGDQITDETEETDTTVDTDEY